MMKLTFICEQYSGQKITYETGVEALPEVIEDFENFLKACGYHFEGTLDFVTEDSDVLNEYNEYGVYDTMNDPLTDENVGDIVIR